MPSHDFGKLSPFDFEELVCDLLQADWEASLEIFTPGRDSGIDLRAFADSKNERIIQCKHNPGSTFSKLVSHLRRDELPKLRKLDPRRYFLATSIGLTPENKKTLLTLLSPYVKRQSDILGRNDLNRLLRRHPDVEKVNFKLWLTSTAVLQRVLHNAEHCQSEFEVERVQRKLPLFVQNEAFPRAQKILDQKRVVVISGEPGIGKTTLADMLLYAHLEQGFEPVVIQGGIEEAKRRFDRSGKQLFYFDDFLGETFLHDRPEFLARNQDAALVSFMEAVRHSKSSRFILTTREHILRKAISASERIGSSSILDHKCILELSDYTFGQKARILYNHLYFSDLPDDYKRAIVQDEFYFTVIRHRNFNPRLIEWLSGHVRVRDVPPDSYQEHVKQLLDSPERIWLHAFEKQVSEAARSVLFIMAVSTYGCEISDIEAAWRALHHFKSKKYNLAIGPTDFRQALSDMEGSFIEIDEGQVSFLNPSIRDFIESLFRSRKEYVLDVIEAATRFSHVRSFHELAEENPSAGLTEVLSPLPVVVEALNRVVGGHHVRWKHTAGGKFEGAYFDDEPSVRLRTLIKWANDARSRSLLETVDLAAQLLDAHWKTFSVYVPDVIHVLQQLEESPWVFSNGGDQLHSRLLARLFERLPDAHRYEWSSALTYSKETKSSWSEDQSARFKAALRNYRLTKVMAEYEECRDIEELEGLRYVLADMQKSHRVNFRKIVKRIDADIVERRRSESDDDGYESVVKREEPQREDPEEVRRLFGSLVTSS